MDSKTSFFPLQAKLLSDVVPVKIDRSFRQMHEFGDLFGRLAVFNQYGHPNLCRCEGEKAGRQTPRKWRYNIFEF